TGDRRARGRLALRPRPRHAARRRRARARGDRGGRMTPRLLEHGGPLSVEGHDERIGAGPWARWLASAAVPDEGTHRAERGRRLARSGAVSRVTVSEGSVTARVTGTTGNEYEVSLAAGTVPAAAWQAAVRAARGRSGIQTGIAGK